MENFYQLPVIKHADILNGGEMAFVMIGRHGKLEEQIL